LNHQKIYKTLLTIRHILRQLYVNYFFSLIIINIEIKILTAPPVIAKIEVLLKIKYEEKTINKQKNINIKIFINFFFEKEDAMNLTPSS